MLLCSILAPQGPVEEAKGSLQKRAWSARDRRLNPQVQGAGGTRTGGRQPRTSRKEPSKEQEQSDEDGTCSWGNFRCETR